MVKAFTEMGKIGAGACSRRRDQELIEYVSDTLNLKILFTYF